MWTWITKKIDRAILDIALRRMPPEFDLQPRGEEAAELMASAAFFGQDSEPPRDLALDDRGRFQFPSSITTPWPVTNMVHGRLDRAGANWRERPTVILVHGYNAEAIYLTQMQKWAERLTDAGMNAMLFVLPYHLNRRPPRGCAVRNIFCGDLFSVAQAVHQCMADTMSLIRWLKGQGVPSVGLWGNSLGAWLSGLIVTQTDEADCAALLTPVSRMDRALRELTFAETLRQAMAQTPIPIEPLNLTSWQAKIPAQNILSLAGRYDQFAPLETVEELHETWPGAELQTFEHGHISITYSPEVAAKTVAWFGERLRT